MGHASPFEDAVSELFDRQFRHLFRYLDRLSGDPDQAADLAQEAFVRLYERGSIPEEPAGWLVTVATNLLRDAQRRTNRRERIIASRANDPAVSTEPDGADSGLVVDETRQRVRHVLATLAPRDQQLLLLRHEGYSYRELAHMLNVEPGSVGTLLVRATRAFHAAFMEAHPCD